MIMLSLKKPLSARIMMQQVQFLAAQSRPTAFPCHITQRKYQSRVQTKCARKLVGETNSIRDNGVSEVNQVLVLGSMLVPFTLGLGFVGSHAKCRFQSGYADEVGDLLLLVFLPAGWVVHAAMPALDVLRHRHERIGVCVGYMHDSIIKIVADTGSGCDHVNKPM